MSFIPPPSDPSPAGNSSPPRHGRYNRDPVTHRARTRFAAFSLLLCILCAAACVASYIMPLGVTNTRHFRDSKGDVWGYSDTSVGVHDGRAYLHRLVFTRNDPSLRFSGRPGLSVVTSVRGEQFTDTWLPYKHWARPFSPLGPRIRFGTITESQWTVPLWALVALFAIPPIRWLVHHRREKLRNAAAVCVRCGYDLRASRDRCPECGQAIRMPASRKGSTMP